MSAPINNKVMVRKINSGSVRLEKIFHRKKYRPVNDLDRICRKLAQLDKHLQEQQEERARCSIYFPQQPNDISPEVAAEGLMRLEGCDYLMVPLEEPFELPRNTVIKSPSALIEAMSHQRDAAGRQSFLIH